MAVSQRILQQGDGLETLKELLQTVQDPKLISKAHEAYRKEIALTEAEEKRVKEGKDFIAKYDSLLNDINQKIAAHEEDKAVHEKEVTDFLARTDLETARFNEWETRLLATTAQQTETAAKHSADTTTLNNASAQLKETYDKKEAALIAREIEVKRSQSANDALKNDLDAERDALAKRMRDLKERLATF